jgi:hypothetical protein
MKTMTKRKLSGNYLLSPILILLTISNSSNLKAAPVDFPFYAKNTSAATSPPTTLFHQPDSVMPVLPLLYGLHEHKRSQTEIAFPTIPINSQAAKFVSGYLQKNDEALQKVRKKSQPYFHIIESVFSKHGLPLELKYLAVVESELKRTAVSHMGAAGPWQLMPTTAHELGLKITSKYDERKHYYKSTTAAAKYLKRLYTIFDDWLLVIAAYNSGPGTVFKAIRKSGSRNFWKLQYYLPAETRGHVKRFIGTHYYFESAGSETTLTKAETVAYQKSVAAYEASFVCTLAEWKSIAAQLAEQPVTLGNTNAATDTDAVKNEDE